MTQPAYVSDAYLRERDVTVLRVGEDAGRRFVVLDDTVFYPEGGGQPPDHGTIGGIKVVDVQQLGREIRHYVEGELAIGPARAVIDWTRRLDHMQQHTGQHLLSAVAEDRFGLSTTAFHLGRELCDVELSTTTLGSAGLATLEDAVAIEVRAAREVVPRHVSQSDYAAMNVRSRGLPADHEGDVRLVEITGIDSNTCGGTHLRSTAEIEALVLLRAESMRGGTRVHFVAGERARRRNARNEARLLELRLLLNTSDDDLANTVERRLGEVRDAAKRERALAGRLAEHEAAAILARAEPVVAAHFGDGDAAFLQQVARILARGPKVALLTAGAAEGVFVLCAGAAVEVDLRALGAGVATVLHGKGGGSGKIFQGKCAAVEQRDAALAALERAINPGRG